jgi:hypothetical protein
MDILNFIYWIRSGRQVTSVDANKTLIPLGLKDGRRDDDYLAGAISVADFVAQYSQGPAGPQGVQGPIGPQGIPGPVGPVSEAFYFYLYDNCGPEDTRLGFLNNRGGYDYYTFTKYRQDIKKIKRETYDNRYYATSLSSPDRYITDQEYILLQWVLTLLSELSVAYV